MSVLRVGDDMILAGDVGGTKTVLAVYESIIGTLEKLVEETVPSTGDSLDKGRIRGLLSGIPVVAQNDKAPLIGAARYAARLF